MAFNPNVWRLLGFASSIVGFICFALGPSFQKLFGRWNLLKIVVYCTFSSMLSLFMLSANYFRRRFPRVFLFKALVSFLVLVFTSLYSYYDDRVKDSETEGREHRSILSLISFGSFALMCMTLSSQVRPGFEVGMSNFFLGCLVVGVMKKNFLEGLGVAVLCSVVMSIRYYSDLRREQRRHRGGGFELHDIVVDRDGLLEETQQILSPLSLTTLRRRPVNLESSSLRRESQKLETYYESEPEPEPDTSLERLRVYLNTWSLPRHINFRTLKYVFLSASDYSTALSEDLIKALRQRRISVRCSSGRVDQEN